uniref:Uncharacterized protein n=1 Tax=viral metagenome TaxID=1070528 RepID=A0A6C0HGP5_9ZZZZ
MEHQPLLERLLQNGLLIEEIPFELRTESICCNALKWGLNTQDYPLESCKDRVVLCTRIMNCFPPEILLTGFVTGNLSKFI